MWLSKRWMGLLAVVSVMIGGCAFSSSLEGRGPEIAVQYDLPNLKKIDIGGTAQVNLIQSDRQVLVVQAQENIVDSLVVDIRRGVLSIQPERGTRFSGRTNITYDIYVSDISEIELSGSLDLHSEGFATSVLELEFGGSINAVLRNLNVDELSLSAGGSADAELSGQAEQLTIRSGGSADIEAAQLRAQFVTIESAGSASMEVWAEQSLKVKAAGSANIRYLGRPLVEQRVAGSARVSPRSE